MGRHIYECSLLNKGVAQKSFKLNFLKIFKENVNFCFSERPLMTRLHRVPSDFETPKVRESFVSKFVYDTEEDQVNILVIYQPWGWYAE